MKNKILATVSLVALTGALPALAETAKTQTETSTTGNIVDDAKTAVTEIKKDTSKAYETIKATLVGKEKADENTPYMIETRKTANGMIGHHVYNEKHEGVAKVTDIILDKDGKASMVVVSDGMFGIGKKAAFDYSAITRVEKDGDVIMPITQKTIDNAPSFAYGKTKGGDKMRVIPDNGYSVSRLLRGRLLNQNKEPLADIENIVFKNGMADQLIIGFDKTLGFGGEKAVILFSDATIIRRGNALDFQLSTNKVAQFEAYKKALNN